MKSTDCTYKYSNLPIPGGGYVTGFQFHRKVPGCLYARTDIGGTYRYDPASESWINLCTRVGMDDLSETFPIAIALDDNDPDLLYVACGDGRGWWGLLEQEHMTRDCGVLAVSHDRGGSFTYSPMPCYIHGNLPGRGTGSRLLVSPADSSILIFASQKDGLLISRDRGMTWQKRDVCGEKHLTLAWLSDDGRTLIVGTAGIDTRTPDMRGHGLYISHDLGASFEKLACPDNHVVAGSLISGYVPQRAASDDRYLYITLSNTGSRNYLREMGYSCDTGHLLGGKIIRYTLSDMTFTDITPEISSLGCSDDHKACASGVSCPDKPDDLPYGFGGISTCTARPGLIAVSTLCRDYGDVLYLSFDYGEHWEAVLHGLELGGLHFSTSYMRPEYNGGYSLLHWESDVRIDPFDPDRLWFNTGTGVFTCKDLTSPTRSFTDSCRGIEETVHLNLYSPPSGDIRLIDILGDLGGFAFRDLDSQCENSFADDNGNRYITCLNADYPDSDPSMIAVTARGNWTGKTTGGLILSHDGAHHFTRLPLPWGLSDKMDNICNGIERPNVNTGWVAVGADGKTIVLGLAECERLPADCIAVSCDEGRTWSHTAVYRAGEIPAGSGTDHSPERMKVFADRTVPGLFYGFGENGRFYVSRDNGLTFHEKCDTGLPPVEFGFVDCADKTEIRGDSGYPGVFYLALGKYGLWKLTYDREQDEVSCVRISSDDDSVFRMGLGRKQGEEGYIGCSKALYICGIIDGCYGFFRSDDGGTSWHRLNDDAHRYGDINSIEGDSQVPGVFYIGSGSFGVLAGQPDT